MRRVPTILFLLTVASRTASAQELATQAEAIRRAEDFVRRNGYVRRADADPSRLALESCCQDSPGAVEELLDRREGTLLPDACAVGRGTRGRPPGWSVIFCLDPRSERHAKNDPDYLDTVSTTGRCVSTDAAANPLQIEHQGFFLTFPGVTPLDGLRTLEQLLERQRRETIRRRAIYIGAPALLIAVAAVAFVFRRRRRARPFPGG